MSTASSLFPLPMHYHYARSTVVIRAEGPDSGSWSEYNSSAVSCLHTAKASEVGLHGLLLSPAGLAARGTGLQQHWPDQGDC